MKPRGTALLWLLLALASALAAGARAEDYPSRQIRIVSPFTAGGPNDVLARIVAQKLAERLGQPVIVDNRPGAGGVLGAEWVAKSPPDGYTLLMVALAHAAHVSLYRKLNYNLETDFQAVAPVALQPLVLTVAPSLPAKSLQDFVSLAKSKPGQLNYGSGGNGTSQHLAMEMFKSAAGVDLVHVPYKGLPQAFTDVMNGQLAAVFSPIAAALPQVKAGRLRALAIASPKRSPLLPNLPTAEEAGLKGFNADTWHGLLAPANTPPTVVAKLNAQVAAVLRLAEVRKNLHEQGAEPMSMTSSEFDVFIKSEIAKYARVVEAAHVQLD